MCDDRSLASFFLLVSLSFLYDFVPSIPLLYSKPFKKNLNVQSWGNFMAVPSSFFNSKNN